MGKDFKITNAIRCNKCDDIIYSRCNHDFRRCTCGAVGIDGGNIIEGAKDNSSTYRVIGKDYENVEVVISDFNTLKHLRMSLFNDYNKRINKYGLMKG